MNLHVISDGIRISLRVQGARIIGVKRYKGSTEKMCRQIINDSYNKKKKYFMVSHGNFKEFYARDFGICCESLISLGYKEEVRNTLKYAMDKYANNGRITTHITPWGKPVDFPRHTPESASYMLNSLIILGDKELTEEYKPFFKKEAKKIYEEDIDKNTGLLRKDKLFSSMKDYSKRKSDCYNNCLLALLAKNLKKTGIKTPLEKYSYQETIKKHFWKGKYFVDDLSGKDILSGDANVFPFWTKTFTERTMLKKAIKSIQEKGLDKPFPLKYTASEDTPKDFHFADRLVPGYEANNVWMHLGLCYLETLRGIDDKRLAQHLKQYEYLLQKHKTFYEVYNEKGRPFSTLLYKSDDAMLWSSILLELCKRIKP